DGTVVSGGGFLVDAAVWRAATQQILDVVDAAHRAHPEQRGVGLTELRHALEDALPIGALFDPLLEKLCESELVRAGSVVGRAAHRAALPAPLQDAGAKVIQALNRQPLDPPSRKEIAPDVLSQRALRFL